MRIRLILWLLLLGSSCLWAQPAATVLITNFAPTPQGWTLGWSSSVPGSSFMVQFQDSPLDRIWRMPASVVSLPLATNFWNDTGQFAQSRFYRVVAVPSAERGKILSSLLRDSMATWYLSAVFSFAGVAITPQYEVRRYSISYETITPWGARTRASGALLIPVGAPQGLPLFSYQHGTLTQTNAAPSFMTLDAEMVAGLAMATTGYAVCMPDYLGLGNSPGLHPFHHARSEATAAIDMLRAARSFCGANGISLGDKLFLGGYSQGGHATMSLCRELERYHSSEFTITACAPMAGAYDLSGVTTTNYLGGSPAPNPYYLLYTLAAYQEVYGLASSLAELLRPPYDSNLPPLMNGNTSGTTINLAMPSDPLLILKPPYLEAFRNDPRHPLRLALAENDVYNWRPLAPMRMYHCAGDRDVIIANSQVAFATFQALGAAQVQFFDPAPTEDHTGCTIPSFLLAKQWFDSLR